MVSGVTDLYKKTEDKDAIRASHLCSNGRGTTIHTESYQLCQHIQLLIYYTTNVHLLQTKLHSTLRRMLIIDDKSTQQIYVYCPWCKVPWKNQPTQLLK